MSLLDICKSGDLSKLKTFVYTDNSLHELLDISIINVVIEFGNIKMVKWLYEIDPSIIKKDLGLGYTSMLIACKYGHIDIVKWIYSIDKKQLGIYNKCNNTPFSYACISGNLTLVKWIYYMDKDQLGIFNEDNITPFSYACISGNLKLVKWIYHMDNDQLGIFDKNNTTPFSYACMSANLKLIKYIYYKDKDQLKIFDKFNNTPFYYSCNYRTNIKTLEWLYNKDNEQIKIKNKCGDSAFFSMYNDDIVENENIEIIAQWIYDRDINHFTSPSNIYMACYINNMRLVKWLDKKFPEIIRLEGISNGYDSLLNLALDRNYFDIIKLIWEKDPDQFKNIDIRCLLHYSSLTIEIFELLGSKLFDIVGKNILFQCCNYDNVNVNLKVIEWIYNKYPEQIETLNEGKNLLYYVCEKGNIKLAQWVYNKDPKQIITIINVFFHKQINDWIKSLLIFNKCPVCRTDIKNIFKVFMKIADNCPICINEINNPIMFQCGHGCCSLCLYSK